MFDIIIIDKASQQMKGSSLVPLVKGCKKAVLVDDYVQLQLTIQPEVVAVGRDRSLFKRVFTSISKDGKNGKVERLILDTQYWIYTSLWTGEIGFLKDLRRMNVALTRVRRGLVVIGNKGTLIKGDDEESVGLWRRLIETLEPVVLESGDSKAQVTARR
ncbi:hypothetical protein B0T21DRAFT_344790 [Apiosordaria backusii]|uniref:DNA2/NAM7 helicase-like C-terminal domain-containing protein n=1 Tax=Apiosordaria backusii TaxID=314023 RepID=A0AA40ESB9_9PEZI|nr:hypothetical protein B0T21DRAFT_344790 [Apiosordaria backusii]